MQGEVFGWIVLYYVLDLVEDFVFFVVVGFGGFDVVVVYVGYVVGQVGYVVFGEVQGVVDLLGMFVFGVEV